mgnify:FL=1
MIGLGIDASQLISKSAKAQEDKLSAERLQIRQ